VLAAGPGGQHDRAGAAGRVRTRIGVKMTTGMPRACPQALIWVQAVVRLSCWQACVPAIAASWPTCAARSAGLPDHSQTCTVIWPGSQVTDSPASADSSMTGAAARIAAAVTAHPAIAG
jgi:hypothetical protein